MIAIALLPLLTMLACTGPSTTPKVAPSSAPKHVPLTDPRVALIGHITRADPTALTWSGSEARARFRGTSIALDVEHRAPPPPEHSGHQSWLAIVIDGKRTDLELPPTRSTVTLARDLAADTVHEISIVKRSEALFGDVVLHGIVVDALEAAPPPRAKRIEVIGDSFTTAFGVLGRGPDCPFEPSTSDFTKSYAALVGERMQADVVTVAWSGRGVIRDFEAREDNGTMPSMWRAAPPLADGRAPDAVLIALAGNDFWSGIPDRGKFFAAFHALLDDVRARYGPKPYVLLIAPPANLNAKHVVDETVATWFRSIAKKRGDPRLWFMQVPTRDPSLGIGCMHHPSAAAHARFAELLEAELRGKL